jgi:hypothetical protein
MMMRYLRVVFLTGCIVGSSQMIAADAQVTIAVRPAVTVAHGTAQLKIQIERNELNRLLTWEVDGPHYYRSSRMELEGATAPRSWSFFVKDLPEGEYAIRATLNRNDNSQTIAVSSIKVLPGLP